MSRKKTYSEKMAIVLRKIGDKIEGLGPASHGDAVDLYHVAEWIERTYWELL